LCYNQTRYGSQNNFNYYRTPGPGNSNLFLSDHLPDRFTAGRPRPDQISSVWRVPVLLAYAIIGPVGQVGEIIISTTSEEIISYTPFEEMKAAAQALYEKHRDEIEAPVL
jgi:hypothetical protein